MGMGASSSEFKGTLHWNVGRSGLLTRPGTATPFSLRLRLHYKVAHAGGVMCLRRSKLDIRDLPFGVTDWSEVEKTEHTGEQGVAYWRTRTFGDIRVRMVEYSP